MWIEVTSLYNDKKRMVNFNFIESFVACPDGVGTMIFEKEFQETPEDLDDDYFGYFEVKESYEEIKYHILSAQRGGK